LSQGVFAFSFIGMFLILQLLLSLGFISGFYPHSE